MHTGGLERPLSPRPRPPPIDPEQLTARSLMSEQSPIEPHSGYQFPSSTSQDLIRSSKTRNSMPHPHGKRLSTSSRSNLPQNMLPSAPASPPTPAPSPTPYQRAPSWASASENEDAFLRDARGHFSNLNAAERQRYLAELLNMCDSQLLSFVHHFVSPRLKKDPFEHLPDELCLRVS